MAGQVGAEAVFLDLNVAPFEPLTPDSGGNIVEKKEKLANAIRESVRGGSWNGSDSS